MPCTPEILVDVTDLNVSICRGCQRVGFSYKNVLIGFDKEDFKAFVYSFSQLQFETSAVLFPIGERRIIVNSVHCDIQFSYNREEFENICVHLNQSITLLNAKEILSHH